MFLQPQSYLTNCSPWLYQGSLMNLRSCGFILFVCFWSKVWILSFSKVVMWFLSMQGGEAFFRNVLESIQEVYLKRNPTAKAVLDLVQSVDNDNLVYDHLAFRTFGVRLLLYYLLHIDKLSWLLGYALLDHLLYLVIVKCCRLWKITVCSNRVIWQYFVLNIVLQHSSLFRLQYDIVSLLNNTDVVNLIIGEWLWNWVLGWFFPG